MLSSFSDPQGTVPTQSNPSLSDPGVGGRGVAGTVLGDGSVGLGPGNFICRAILTLSYMRMQILHTLFYNN